MGEVRRSTPALYTGLSSEQVYEASASAPLEDSLGNLSRYEMQPTDLYSLLIIICLLVRRHYEESHCEYSYPNITQQHIYSKEYTE
jgi:hypothetical protein